MKSWSVLLTLSLLACGAPTEPPGESADRVVRELPNGVVQERRIGTIEHFGDPVRVQVPRSVRRGQEIAVKVATYGGGCIVKGDTEVQVNGLSAVITPYDWEATHLPANFGCTMDLRLYEHTAALRFDRAGTAVLQIRGRRMPSGEVFTLERRITIW